MRAPVKFGSELTAVLAGPSILTMRLCVDGRSAILRALEANGAVAAP